VFDFSTISGLDDEIAISTIEQISPFPFDLVKEECERYSDAAVVFVQVYFCHLLFFFMHKSPFIITG